MKPPDPKEVDESELRWIVWSFTNRREEGELKPYLVELRTETGLNKCECEHFQNRIQPHYAYAIKSGVPYDKIELQECKHLRLAREHLGIKYSHNLIEAAYQREKENSGI